jgi:Flp pilus assembly protein TadG
LESITTSFSKKRERGQTMAEFTLVLPLLVMLLFGILQFGIVFNDYLAVTDAVRAGARVGSVARFLPPGEREQAVKDKVNEAAVDLDTAKLEITVTTSDNWAPGSDVTVKAEYPYTIKLLGIGLKEGDVSSSTTERVE